MSRSESQGFNPSLENGVQVRAFLYFKAATTSSFRKPDVHGIIVALNQSELPEFVWNLVVLDRNGETRPASVTSRIVAPDGKEVGEPRPLFDLTGADANEILTSWGRIPVAAMMRSSGVYRGEVLLDGKIIAISRLRIDAAIPH